jgi:4-hydroxy-3-methylbut-2-enyl diphosphate reductase
MDQAPPTITLRLCGPRGFCAGVDRAIQMVVMALKRYGAPVYVRHEIVHNRYVVDGLREKGAFSSRSSTRSRSVQSSR